MTADLVHNGERGFHMHIAWFYSSSISQRYTGGDQNLALYQARGAHRRQLVRDIPFRNKLDGGKPSCIWRETKSTGKKTKSGGKIGTEK